MFSYILQMTACSGVLYAYYHFFLRNERFHQYNRFYLLFAMALSLILPLLKIPIAVEDTTTNPIYAFVSTGETVVVTSAAKPFNYLRFSYLIYGCIVIWMFFRLLKAIFQVIRIKRAAYSEMIEDIRFVKTSHPDAPFSFFKWLFWSEHIELGSKEGMHMFKHELYHIRSKHSRDLLFMEIVLSVFWFNPFFYLYRKEVKVIQEFLADQHAANDSDAVSYAELLLAKALGLRHQHLINPFFHNQLKRRIIMLTSSKKPQYQWLRKLLVLPVITTAIALFAFTYKKEIGNIVSDKSQANKDLYDVRPTNNRSTIQAFATVVRDTIPAKNKKDSTQKNWREVSTVYNTGSGRYRKLNPVTVIGYTENELPKRVLKEGETKVDVDAKFSGNWSTFLERNLNAQIPTDNGAPAGNYEVLVRFIVNEDGTLSNIEPLTNEGYGMEEEVVRILKKSPEWHPAINNKEDGKNKAVKSYRIQPINFQVIRKGAKYPETKAAQLTSTPDKTQGETEIFTKMEIDPMYPGDWRKFLEQNLKGVIPVEKGAKAGNYTTIIQFIVDKDGTLSDIKPLTKHGYGMEEEAMRVIKVSGKWKPGRQNGRDVKAYRKQPLTFQIQES